MLLGDKLGSRSFVSKSINYQDKKLQEKGWAKKNQQTPVAKDHIYHCWVRGVKMGGDDPQIPYDGNKTVLGEGGTRHTRRLQISAVLLIVMR